MSLELKQNTFLALGVLIVLFFCSIYWLKLGDSYIDQNDNLDSNIVWFKTIVDNKAYFWNNDQLIDGMIGMQPRHVYGSELDPSLWFYSLLGPLVGWIFNYTLVHLLAFFGMFQLLIRIFKHDKEGFSNNSMLYAFVGAVLFALIPFWTNGNLSSAGIPFILVSFFDISHRKFISGFLYSISFALYSHLFLSGVFILVIYVLIIAIYFSTLKRKSILRFHIINIVVTTIIYLLVNYRLIYGVFFSDFVSHRTEMLLSPGDTNWSMIGNYILQGQWHAGLYRPIIAYLSIGISLFFVFRRNSTPKIVKRLSYLFFFIVLSTMIFSLESVKAILDGLPIIGMIQWDRFYFLLPTLIFLQFTLGLYYIRFFKADMIKISLATLLLVLSFSMNKNWNFLVRDVLNLTYEKTTTFNSFYQEMLFTDVRNYLLDEDYSRVASLGLHPGISVFNNIRSVDGYLANYSLASKSFMFDVIEDELKEDEKMADYFLNWGNRCYLFHSEIFTNFDKFDLSRKYSTKFNYAVLKEARVDHILSRVELEDSSVRLMKFFSNDDYSIYLYKII